MSFGLRVRGALPHSLNLCIPVMRKTETFTNQWFKEYTAFSKTELLSVVFDSSKTIPLFYQHSCTW